MQSIGVRTSAKHQGEDSEMLVYSDTQDIFD